MSALSDKAGFDSEGSTNVGNGLPNRRGRGETETFPFLEAGSVQVEGDDGQCTTDMELSRVLSSSQFSIQSKVLFLAAFICGGEGDNDDCISVARPLAMPSLRV